MRGPIFAVLAAAAGGCSTGSEAPFQTSSISARPDSGRSRHPHIRDRLCHLRRAMRNPRLRQAPPQATMPIAGVIRSHPTQRSRRISPPISLSTPNSSPTSRSLAISRPINRRAISPNHHTSPSRISRAGNQARKRGLTARPSPPARSEIRERARPSWSAKAIRSTRCRAATACPSPSS
jgi:hypothetical protein